MLACRSSSRVPSAACRRYSSPPTTLCLPEGTTCSTTAKYRGIVPSTWCTRLHDGSSDTRAPSQDIRVDHRAALAFLAKWLDKPAAAELLLTLVDPDPGVDTSSSKGVATDAAVAFVKLLCPCPGVCGVSEPGSRTPRAAALAPVPAPAPPSEVTLSLPLSTSVARLPRRPSTLPLLSSRSRLCSGYTPSSTYSTRIPSSGCDTLCEMSASRAVGAAFFFEPFVLATRTFGA